MTTADRRSLIRDLYELTAETEVRLRIDDGTRVVGRPSRIDRDEAGIRIEVCPYDGDAPQYRVRAGRTPTGWRDPRVDRRPMAEDWSRYGRLVKVERLSARRTD